MTGAGICRMSDWRPKTLEDKVDMGVHPAVAMMRLDNQTKCPKPDLTRLCSLGLGAAGVLSPAATVAAMSLNGEISSKIGKKGEATAKKAKVKKKDKEKAKKPKSKKKKKKKKDKKSGKKKGKDKASSSSSSSSSSSASGEGGPGVSSVITLGSSSGDESEAIVCDTIL
mmetsp:Transcript_107329/g.320983  ORF Transcript_107329/g.320983 Transcript_107329/m.320983 type:complete len:169 (-) Transcript_107329:46-552(-)